MRNKWDADEEDPTRKDNRYRPNAGYIEPNGQRPGRKDENDPPRRRIREDDPEYRAPAHMRSDKSPNSDTNRGKDSYDRPKPNNYGPGGSIHDNPESVNTGKQNNSGNKPGRSRDDKPQQGQYSDEENYKGPDGKSNKPPRPDRSNGSKQDSQNPSRNGSPSSRRQSDLPNSSKDNDRLLNQPYDDKSSKPKDRRSSDMPSYNKSDGHHPRDQDPEQRSDKRPSNYSDRRNTQGSNDDDTNSINNPRTGSRISDQSKPNTYNDYSEEERIKPGKDARNNSPKDDGRRHSDMPRDSRKNQESPDRRQSEIPKDGRKQSRSPDSYDKDPKDNSERIRRDNDRRNDGKVSPNTKNPEEGYYNEDESDDGSRPRQNSTERKSILKKKDANPTREREDSRPKGVVFREDVKEPTGKGSESNSPHSKPGRSGDRPGKNQPEQGEFNESEVVGVFKKGEKPFDKNKNKGGIKVNKVDFEEKNDPDSRRQSKADKNHLQAPDQAKTTSSEEEEEEDVHPLPGKDVVNIPVKTYSRMKALKGISKTLDDDLGYVDDEDPEQIEALELQTSKAVQLGDSVMKELVENNPKNQFIQALDEEFREIEQAIKKNKDESEEKKKEDMERLVKWQKRLKKLEVKEPTMGTAEKAQLRDMYKRKSFRALVDGDPKDKVEINPKNIQEGKLDDKALKEYVTIFLQKYSERMDDLNTPISKMFAKEANQTLESLEKFEKERPEQQNKELNKLIATAICDKFKSDDDNILDSIVHAADVKEQQSIEFNDLLRAVNNLAPIPFKTLDDIVTEPSTKINLFNMRKDKMTKFTDLEYKDKEADLLKLNSLEKDKQKIEELFINLGKEVLPPELGKKANMYDSSMADMDINFIPIKSDPQQLPLAITEPPKEPTTFNSDDSFNGDIKFGGTNYEKTAVEKRFSMVKPSFIDSDAEFDTSEDNKDKSNITPLEPSKYGIDYRDDLADALELIIEGLSNTLADTRMARQEIKKHNRNKEPLSDAEKLDTLDQLNKGLEECNSLSKEGDQYKAPYENLKREIKQKMSIESNQLPIEHNRGLIKMWGKYNRQLRKLRDENIELLNDIQNSPAMQANEPQTAAELEKVKEQLEEVQKALQQENNHDDKQRQNKQANEPIQHTVIAPEDIEKEIKEQEKKHKEMTRNVESLSGKIENLRRASLMNPHLDGQAKKNHRFSISQQGTKPSKPKDKKSIIHALIQDQREEEMSDEENKKPVKIDEVEETQEKDDTADLEKGVQKIKSQSLAALLALNTEENPEDSVDRINKTLDDPKLKKMIEVMGCKEEADAFQQAVKDDDEEAIQPTLEEFYNKISNASVTEEQAKKIAEETEESDNDTEAKMDQEIQARREARKRAEANAKNIKDIVAQLKSELEELRNKSEDLEKAGKRQPTKLRHVKKNIDESKGLLAEVPIPAAESISHIKQVTRDADTLVPKNEELTPERITEIEEFDDLNKQINKNVDQLSVNMTDVAEFRLKSTADNLVDLGKDKKIDLKALSKDGSAPENSADLTPEDRQELKVSLDKLKQDAEAATKIVEEWVFAKAEEIGHLAEVIKTKETKNKQLPNIREAVAKIIKALNQRKNLQAVPRGVLELSKASEAFQQEENRNGQTDPSTTSDAPTSTNLAKAVVHIEDAADRYQDIMELLQQYVNNVIKNTEKAISNCDDNHKSPEEKVKEEIIKRRNSARKHDQRVDLHPGVNDGDDSVEKYYYSEFTEGSLEDKQPLNPKAQHNRNQDARPDHDFKKRPEALKETGDDQHNDVDKVDKRGSMSKENKARKSQMKHIEEKLMRGQDKRDQPRRYETLKDEADQDKSQKDGVYFDPTIASAVKSDQEPDSFDEIIDEEDVDRHKKKGNDHLPYDKRKSKTFQGKDEEEESSPHRSSTFHQSQRDEDDEYYPDDEDEDNHAYNEDKKSEGKGDSPDRRKSKVDSQGRPETKEYIETASRRFSKKPDDKYEYIETASGKFIRRPDQYDSEERNEYEETAYQKFGSKNADPNKDYRNSENSKEPRDKSSRGSGKISDQEKVSRGDDKNRSDSNPRKPAGKPDRDHAYEFSNEEDKPGSKGRSDHGSGRAGNDKESSKDKHNSQLSDPNHPENASRKSVRSPERPNQATDSDSRRFSSKPADKYEYIETASGKFIRRPDQYDSEERNEYEETAYQKFGSKNADPNKDYRNSENSKEPRDKSSRGSGKISDQEKVSRGDDKNRSDSNPRKPAGKPDRDHAYEFSNEEDKPGSKGRSDHGSGRAGNDKESSKDKHNSQLSDPNHPENASRKSVRSPERPNQATDSDSRRFSSKLSDKAPSNNDTKARHQDSPNREETIERASRRYDNRPDKKETVETAYRRKSNGPNNDEYEGDKAREDDYDHPEDRVNDNYFSDEEDVSKSRKPTRKSESPSTRGRSGTKYSIYDENHPTDKFTREGEIIVAEIEEGKAGNKVRFSVVDPQGRKSVIDNQHVVDPQTELGEELFKTASSIASKTSEDDEYEIAPRRPVDPIVSALETRKSVIRERLALHPAEERNEEGHHKPHRASIKPELPKRHVILDGRPRDPEFFDKEVVIFNKPAISRTIQNTKKPIDPSEQSPNGKAVQPINPKIADPKSSSHPSHSNPNPSTYVPPMEKPKNFEEKKKTYYIEDKEKIGEDVIPCLVELDFMYYQKKDEDKDEPEEERLNPLDPFESFYQECDQTHKDVPNIPNNKVYKRKIRKLKPEEQKEHEQEKKDIERLLQNPNLVPTEKLVRTDEWANGKPVYKKQIDFIPTKNHIPKEPEYTEGKLDYYQMIEKDSDFTESIMFPEKSVIRSYSPQQHEGKFNAFDSLNKSELLAPVKFMLAQGPDGTIRIFQLETYEGNPLFETEAGRLSLPTNIEASIDGFKTMFRHSGNFNQSPVLEPQTSQIFSVSNLPSPVQRQSELQSLGEKRILSPDDLVKFLEMMKNVPGVKIELFKQSPEELKGRSIVEEGLHFNSMAYTDRASILKQIGDLQKQGKIVGGDQHSKPKVVLEESIKLSTLHSDDKTRKSFFKEPEIKAVKIEEKYKDKPLYQIIDNKDPDVEEGETNKLYDPVSELKEVLNKVGHLSEAQIPFSEIAKKALEYTDDVATQKKQLKKLFKEIENVSKEKGEVIEDWMFLPNGTSMVNNSLKSEIPYKDCDWMKLSEIYKYPTFLSNFSQRELFPAGAKATKLAACLAALCDYPDRIKRLFGSTELSLEGQYTAFLQCSGKLEPVIIDEKVPVENSGDNMFILEPSNHEKGREAFSTPKPTRFGSPKPKSTPDTEVEIWPQILAKALAKILGCYERLLNQDMANSLADLTGMPVKTIPISSLEYRWIRENYKRSSVMICKANRSWINSRKRDCSIPASELELEHWVINQVVTIGEDVQMIEIKNHHCDKAAKMKWNTEEYLQITEDWMKHRRFKKLESHFWMTYEDFKNTFDSVICSIDRSENLQTYKRIEYKNARSAACVVEVSQPTAMTIGISQVDIVMYPKDYEYSVLRTFLLKENNTTNEEEQNDPFEIIKCTYHVPNRDSHIDLKLEKGRYKLLIDIESRSAEYGKLINLNFFYDKRAKFCTLEAAETHSLHKAVLSSLSIRRGNKVPLSEDGSVRKYVLEAAKVGMIICTYTNRSSQYFTVAEKLAPFDFLCSKALEDGDKMVISLPPNSLKLVSFYHNLSPHPTTVKVLESTCLMK